MAESTTDNSRLADYKCRKTSSSQEARRKKLLEEQKLQRDNLFNKNRVLNEEHVCDVKKKIKDKVRSELTFSEWLLEIPDDFQTNWVMVPCPYGKRVLIIAAGGVTTAYTKRQTVVAKFHSALPGGHASRDGYSKGLTMLDCMWNPKSYSFYVLDVLAWNTQPVVNCDAEFRFFWLQSKMSEIPELCEKSSSNKWPFYFLPRFPCDKTSLEIAMSSNPMIHEEELPVDGLLFYHLQAQYTAGRTPLIGWLKPFMMSDALQVPVAEVFLKDKPDPYDGYKQFIVEFESKSKRKRKPRRKQKGEKMEMESEWVDDSGDSMEVNISTDCASHETSNCSSIDIESEVLEPAVEHGSERESGGTEITETKMCV